MRIKIDYKGDSRKDKCYARLVSGVDLSKANGYAFQGEFLNEREYDLPEGAIVLFVGEMGSWKNRNYRGFVYQVQGEKFVKLEDFDYRANFLTLRDFIAKLLGAKPNPLAGFTDEQILAEVARRKLIVPS